MFKRDLSCSLLLILSFICVSSPSYALTYDFVGPDAKNWFDEFVKSPDTIKAGDAGWELTADGLTTNDNITTGHQKIGIKKNWTNYTLESKYQYLKQGSHKEAHLYVRWNDDKNNYFFRTIGRKNNAGANSGYSIEWLRKVDNKDNEGDISDDEAIIGQLKDKTVYGLRGTIEGRLLKVDFFKDGKWQTAGEVTYPDTHKTGGIGVGRSSAQVAWKYLKVNGTGIPSDATTRVESLNKVATTWGKLKKY